MENFFADIWNLFSGNNQLATFMTVIAGIAGVLALFCEPIMNLGTNSAKTETLMSLDEKLVGDIDEMKESPYRDALTEHHKDLQKRIHRRFARSYFWRHMESRDAFKGPLSLYFIISTLGVFVFNFLDFFRGIERVFLVILYRIN